jgi:hypothetical protein
VVRRFRIQVKVEPHVGAARHIHVARRDADDPQVSINEPDRFADDLRVATEDAYPEVMREHDRGGGGVARELVRRESGAPLQREAEEREEVFIDASRGECERRLAVAQQGRVEAQGHRRADDRQLRVFQAGHLERTHQSARDTSVGERGPQRPQVRRVRVRQRPQQRRMCHAEYRRRRANPQRQRADRGDREGRRAPHRPHGVADVAGERVEPEESALVAHALRVAGDAAEITARRVARVPR